ncbi:MAG TPA: hypothetical protein VM240_07485 [Verrucomicrobiae bacterium]|nr:hypothetical protein [Verrucomicrobiae bacterium]
MLDATARSPLRWTARTGFSAFVHLAHSAANLVLTLFVPGTAGSALRYAWGVGAFFSFMTLLLLLRLGNYEGTTEAEVGKLIRQGYWVATSIYLCLLAASLYLLLAR